MLQQKLPSNKLQIGGVFSLFTIRNVTTDCLVLTVMASGHASSHTSSHTSSTFAGDIIL